MAKYDSNLDSNISRTVDLYHSKFLPVGVRCVRIVDDEYQVPIGRGSATTLLSRGAIFTKCEKWPFLEVHNNWLEWTESSKFCINNVKTSINNIQKFQDIWYSGLGRIWVCITPKNHVLPNMTLIWTRIFYEPLSSMILIFYHL